MKAGVVEEDAFRDPLVSCVFSSSPDKTNNLFSSSHPDKSSVLEKLSSSSASFKLSTSFFRASFDAMSSAIWRESWKGELVWEGPAERAGMALLFEGWAESVSAAISSAVKFPEAI